MTDEKRRKPKQMATVTRIGDRISDLRLVDRAPTASPPGFYLRAVLDALKMSQAQLAARTGLSTKHINQVIQGVATLSPEIAIVLERAVGVPSKVWNDMEAAHQDAQARERAQQRLGDYVHWLHQFPTEELQRRGIVNNCTDAATQAGQLLSFFQVADPDAYSRVWSGAVASGYRRAGHLKVDPNATALWLRLAEKASAELDLAPYSQESFTNLLPKLKALTRYENDEEALRELQHLCAQVGVAVVYVADIKGSRACGAARWPTPAHPMIVLSGRYQYADSFWFSFFHEAVHVTTHPKREIYIDLDQRTDNDDGLETEADRGAARHLLGPVVLKRLHQGMRHPQVRELADQAGVHEGIIAGQLAHMYNEYPKYSRLRRKIELPDTAHK